VNAPSYIFFLYSSGAPGQEGGGLKIQTPSPAPCPLPPPPAPKRGAEGSVGRSELEEHYKMPKRPRGDAAVERRMKRIDRAVSRYGASAVAKYWQPSKRSRLMPPETKYFDTSFSSTCGVAADWTGTEVPMSSYIQSDGTTVGSYTDAALIPSAIGAGYGQVNGNKYYIKHIRMRGEVTPQVASDQADVPIMQVTRLVLVHDTQPNGAQAQGEDVFTDLGTAAQCNYSYQAMGAGNGGRFRILKDKIVRHQPAVAGTDGTNTNSTVRSGTTFSMSYRPKKPIQVILKANSSTPTVASLSNNNIFLLAHSNGSAGPFIIGACRVYFQD